MKKHAFSVDALLARLGKSVGKGVSFAKETGLPAAQYVGGKTYEAAKPTLQRLGKNIKENPMPWAAGAGVTVANLPELLAWRRRKKPSLLRTLLKSLAAGVAGVGLVRGGQEISERGGLAELLQGLAAKQQTAEKPIV